MTEYNIALIGCGRIGFILENDKLRNKPCTHYGGLTESGLSINHACDTSLTRLTDFKEKNNIKDEHCFSNHRDLFQNSELHCVIIATPTPTHFQIAKSAIDAGVRVIVLEKPVASSLIEAQNLMKYATKKNVHVIVNHERRYDYRYQSAKKLLEDNQIGKIISAVARISTGPYRGKSNIKEGGGPLLHDGTHLIDIINYFFGSCKSLTGKFTRSTRTNGFEDTAHAWMMMEKDINVFVESGGAKKYFGFEIDIWGSKGRLIIGNGINRLFLSKKSELYEGFRDLNEVEFPLEKKSNCFTNLYLEVKQVLAGEKVKTPSSLKEGYASMEIINGIYYSSFKKMKKIKFPLKPKKINLNRIFKLK